MDAIASSFIPCHLTDGALSNLYQEKLGSYRKVRVVLGNRSCDLDSAVCALVQGLIEYLDAEGRQDDDVAVIPVMNIREREYRIKTEVVHILELHDVSANLLTFRDQIDLLDIARGSAGRLQLILVDHHDLMRDEYPLADSVVEVIDHRPRDSSWPWNGRKMNLQMVGSCATLVAENLLAKHRDVLDAKLSSLLRGAILIDTFNMSKEAKRATPLDFEILETLEKEGSLKTSRDEVFNDILTAKTDISKLTPDDLVIKDLKFTGSGVPIIGLPMLVENFLVMENAVRAVESFTREEKRTLSVLIGLELTDKRVARDVAVFSLTGDVLGEKVIQALTSSSQPFLDLKPVKRIQTEAFELIHYRQGNLTATRKQILPIVQSVTSDETCR